MKFREAFLRQPNAVVFIEASLVLLGIALVDYYTDLQWSLFIFYAFPVVMLVWRGYARGAITLSILCAIAWYLANDNAHPMMSDVAYLWASFSRMVFYLFVAIGGMAMRNQRDEARARVEAMERARELEQEIVRLSEHQQMRIGQDLHDGLCQNLAAIDCAAACLKSDLENRDVPEAATAAIIQKMLQDALLEARSLARGIFPVQMDAEGLPTALEELVATMNRLRQTPATIEVEGEMRIADPEVSMHLYRIAQEAMSNAQRHAKATQIGIRLSRVRDRFTMTITDDGCGFAYQGLPSNGMGLRTMDYRARQIGADLTTQASPKHGTVVRCSLLLPHANNNSN